MNSFMQMPAFRKGSHNQHCALGPFSLCVPLVTRLRNAALVLRNATMVIAASLALAMVPNIASAQDKAAGKPAKPDIAAGQQIPSGVCSACHAADGNSPSPANPNAPASQESNDSTNSPTPNNGGSGTSVIENITLPLPNSTPNVTPSTSPNSSPSFSNPPEVTRQNP